jgi:sigma-B regulation protein RsbU (phosphoserine phosphatase)
MPHSPSLSRFWNRITTGLTLQELWTSFRKETRSSIAVYETEGEPRIAQGKLPDRIAALSKAMFFKLSPARRIVLLLSLLFIVAGLMPRTENSDHFIIAVPPVHFFLGTAGILFLLAMELADRVALKRDLEIAKDIQKLLLPKEAPQVPGIEIAFTTRPANTVAGDYYDVFFRPGPSSADPERLFFVVADVAGKGIPAGLLAATLHASLRVLAEDIAPIASVVAKLNHYTHARSDGGRRFATAFCAEWDRTTNLLEYVNAGHNAPVLRRRDGTLERLEEGGLPLGVFAEWAYNHGSVTLNPGDNMVVFTDGVIEAMNESGAEFTEARLLDILRRSTRPTAGELLKYLVASVEGFAGTAPQYDDVTCLIFHVVP